MSKHNTVFVINNKYLDLLLPILCLVPILHMLTGGANLPVNQLNAGFLLVLCPLVGIVVGGIRLRTKPPAEDPGKRVKYSKKRVRDEDRVLMLRLRAHGVHRDDIARYFNVNPLFVSKLASEHPEFVMQLAPEEQEVIALQKATRKPMRPTSYEATQFAAKMLNEAFLLDRTRFIAAFSVHGSDVLAYDEEVTPKIVRGGTPKFINIMPENADDVARNHHRQSVVDPTHMQEPEPATEAPVHEHEHATDTESETSDTADTALERDDGLSGRELHVRLMCHGYEDGLMTALVICGMKSADIAKLFGYRTGINARLTRILKTTLADVPDLRGLALSNSETTQTNNKYTRDQVALFFDVFRAFKASDMTGEFRRYVADNPQVVK